MSGKPRTVDVPASTIAVLKGWLARVRDTAAARRRKPAGFSRTPRGSRSTIIACGTRSSGACPSSWSPGTLATRAAPSPPTSTATWCPRPRGRPRRPGRPSSRPGATPTQLRRRRPVGGGHSSALRQDGACDLFSGGRATSKDRRGGLNAEIKQLGPIDSLAVISPGKRRSFSWPVRLFTGRTENGSSARLMKTRFSHASATKHTSLQNRGLAIVFGGLCEIGLYGSEPSKTISFGMQLGPKSASFTKIQSRGTKVQ